MWTRANLHGAGIRLFQCSLWTAIISKDSISIGCQIHSVEKWKRFTDAEISVMHNDALSYWNENKAIIFAIVESIE